MNDKIQGLVLRINDYKDNDLLLQVFTREHSIISLIGKSSKKITSKQHFYEGCLYEFMFDYKDSKTIYSLHNSKLIKAYYDLNNTKLFSFKNILFEMILKSRETLDSDCFDNICFVLDKLNDENKYLLGSLFVSYMNRLHGINPNVDECVTCKSKKVVSISNLLGGFLCEKHKGAETVRSIDTLKRFRLISKAKFKDYEIIQDNKYEFLDFKILIEFFMSNSSISLKTYDFYTKVM